MYDFSLYFRGCIMKQTVYFICSCTAMLLMVNACKKTDPNAAVPQTKLIVFNASPDAKSFDVILNGFTTLSNVSYPERTQYLRIAPGTYHLTVPFTNNTDIKLTDATIDFRSGVNYSLLAVDSASKIKLTLITDNLKASDTAASVRFFQLSPNAPYVSLSLNDSVYTGFSFRKFNDEATIISNANFRPQTSGTYTIKAITTDSSKTVLDSLPNIPLLTRKIYTIYLKGFAGGTGSQKLKLDTIQHN